MSMGVSTGPRRVWGHAPPGICFFRLPETPALPYYIYSGTSEKGCSMGHNTKNLYNIIKDKFSRPQRKLMMTFLYFQRVLNLREQEGVQQ